MITLVKKIIGFLLQIRIDILSKKKLQKIQPNVRLDKKNRTQKDKYKKLWLQLGKKPPTLFLNLLNSISGINSYKYVPENIHYGIIEPTLNHKAYALTFNDKNFFERYLSSFKHHFPITVLRGINGVLHDEKFKYIIQEEALSLLSGLSESEYYIIKPATETGGGENVLLLKKEQNNFIINEKSYTANEFITFLGLEYRNNFVLQIRVEEHQWFKDFNSSSVNTVRLYAYRSVKDEQVHPFHAYIRFGKEGSIVDSSSQGGRTCGISNDGILNDFALGRYGEKYKDIKPILEKKGTKVPRFDEMKEIANEIAKTYYYHRLLGFDFCVDKDDNIRLFEVNTLNIGIINQQMNSGPLFGDFTDEVIEYCKTHKKSVVLDFYI